ncbi:uncharacterized protein TM35_000351650 [Trypanosoma theileri]|uniref:Uncharacterized protein n=1 Tax=Trypanosoma theileri TaxID=67003 RepID=A0A1X0NLG2_9TRYP|nr:uncharacterized protein TM35_000351650 [Trypanosoma theileri]ORC85421.1 hypothetical protein TM35_000351650 [Trypanosoma theileri]
MQTPRKKKIKTHPYKLRRKTINLERGNRAAATPVMQTGKPHPKPQTPTHTPNHNSDRHRKKDTTGTRASSKTGGVEGSAHVLAAFPAQRRLREPHWEGEAKKKRKKGVPAAAPHPAPPPLQNFPSPLDFSGSPRWGRQGLP